MWSVEKTYIFCTWSMTPYISIQYLFFFALFVCSQLTQTLDLNADFLFMLLITCAFYIEIYLYIPICFLTLVYIIVPSLFVQLCCPCSAVMSIPVWVHWERWKKSKSLDVYLANKIDFPKCPFHPILLHYIHCCILYITLYPLTNLLPIHTELKRCR